MSEGKNYINIFIPSDDRVVEVLDGAVERLGLSSRTDALRIAVKVLEGMMERMDRTEEAAVKKALKDIYARKRTLKGEI